MKISKGMIYFFMSAFKISLVQARLLILLINKGNSFGVIQLNPDQKLKLMRKAVPELTTNKDSVVQVRFAQTLGALKKLGVINRLGKQGLQLLKEVTTIKRVTVNSFNVDK